MSGSMHDAPVDGRPWPNYGTISSLAFTPATATHTHTPVQETRTLHGATAVQQPATNVPVVMVHGDPNVWNHYDPVRKQQFQQQQQQQQDEEDDDGPPDGVDGRTVNFGRFLPFPAAVVLPRELREKFDEEDREAIKKGKRPPNADKTRVLHRERVRFGQRLLAEMVGTVLLVACHAILRIKATEGSISEEGNALAAGLTLVFLIYSFGSVSGAHFNPVITLVFALRRIFPPVWALCYWVVQFAGAIIGGAIVEGFYGADAKFGVNFVHQASRFDNVSAMMFEAFLTFLLVMTVLEVSLHGAISGLHAALAVGAVLATGVMLGAKITGGSMNPFRALGPAIVTDFFDDVWPALVGPIIGGLIALVISFLITPSKKGNKAKTKAMGSTDQ